MKKRLATLRARLTSVNRTEPLHKFSLAVIILLDLIILQIVFAGLADHTKQLTTAAEFFPPAAQEALLDQGWSETARMARLQELLLREHNQLRYNIHSPFHEQYLKKMHPTAALFFRRAKQISARPELQSLFVARQKLLREHKQATRAFETSRQTYDTQLLETIATDSELESTATAASAQLEAQRIQHLTQQIDAIDRQLNTDATVQTLWTLIESEERDHLVKDYKRFQHRFKFKQFFWQVLFLIPLFGAVYGWNARSVKKELPIQTLLSSHLLIIVTIPILIKIVELVIDLIPNHFFRKLFELLQSLHLMALWHYFLIAAVGATGLLIIYFIQRKLFNAQRTKEKRMSKGHCISCNRRIPDAARFCPLCGTSQLKCCPQCNQLTEAAGTYCSHCGATQ